MTDDLIFRNRVKSLGEKYFAFPEAQIRCMSIPVPPPLRGALRDRHERWVRDAMDVFARKTSGESTDGEGVWSWPPDAGVKLARSFAGDGGYQARHPGESAL